MDSSEVSYKNLISYQKSSFPEAFWQTRVLHFASFMDMGLFKVILASHHLEQDLGGREIYFECLRET